MIKDQAVDDITPENLKDLALNAKKVSQNTKPKDSTLDPDDIILESKQVLESIIHEAKLGKLEFTYKVEGTREHLQALAAKIRSVYPQRLMIIKNFGKSTLTFNWSGKYEV